MSEKDNNVMPLATDPHNLGEFDNVYDAMRRYPNGGVDGDYIYILGVQHFWNVNRQSWGILKDKEDNLVQMVEDFIGLFERRGYVFAGYALPDTTPVSGLDNIFYIAAKNGVYTHFGSDLKLLNEVAILRKPRRSSIWIKDSMDIPNSERIDVIDDAISRINVDIETIKSAIIGMENDLDGVHDSIDDINKDIDAFKKETSENFEEVNSDLDKVEKRLDYIPKESFLSARPAGFKPDIDLTPEITVDRAWRDHEGNVIRDTYITRRGLRNEIIDITNQQVTDLKPGSVDPDDLSEATKQLIGNKSITNLPDEEDITVTDNQTLKLKDKEYAPKDYSGMGRVYLRKHYVNGVNTLTQHMMRKPNTIYIIQYDYCLAGQTIEVPENCVLRFEGGSLRNGTLVGHDSYIDSSLSTIFHSLEINGSFLNRESNVSWFTNEELTTKIFKSLSNISRNVNLNKCTLWCSRIDIKDIQKIHNGRLQSKNINENQSVNILYIHDTNSDVLIENVIFDGMAHTYAMKEHNPENLLRIENCFNVTVKQCEFLNYSQCQSIKEPVEEWGLYYQSAVNINNNHNVVFDSNIAHDNHFEQFIFYDPTLKYSLRVTNCITYGNYQAYGTFINYGFKSTLYDGNYLTQGVASFIATQSDNCIYTNNYFEDCSYFAISTEWTGGCYMNKSQLIKGNIAKNCRYGAFNVGVYDIIISDNIIESCGGRYGSIYCKGKTYGNHPYAIQSAKSLPYDTKEFSPAYNIVISDNIILNDLGNDAICIKSHSHFLDVTTIDKFGVINNILISNNQIESKSRPFRILDSDIEGLKIINNTFTIKGKDVSIYIKDDATSLTSLKNSIKGLTIKGNNFKTDKIFGNYIVYSLIRGGVSDLVFEDNNIEAITTAESVINFGGNAGTVTVKSVKNNNFPYCVPILKQAGYLYKGNSVPITQNEYLLNGSVTFFPVNCMEGDVLITNSKQDCSRFLVVERGTTNLSKIPVSTTSNSPVIVVSGDPSSLTLGGLVNISEDIQEAVILEIYTEDEINYARLNKPCKTSGSHTLSFKYPILKNIDVTLTNKVVII